MDTYNKWLTIEDLATYLKLSRTKLYGMAQRGEIPATRWATIWKPSTAWRWCAPSARR